ncbi:hypothetical protein BJ944DRAFT_274348 [Cunninghamella echinulata]|nr:hypothetical protein BJ944DRAFT_274348 [Cunninghamella echinulata]
MNIHTVNKTEKYIKQHLNNHICMVLLKCVEIFLNFLTTIYYYCEKKIEAMNKCVYNYLYIYGYIL